MATSTAKTVAQYLKSLPADRRAAISAVRDVINANLPDGYVEGMVYGMIGWYVPPERHGETYKGHPIGPAALASQKQYMALYLASVYSDPALGKWFTAAYAKTGKKLDMGKSCVRFKKLEDLPLDVIGETIRKVPPEAMIAQYEAVRTPTSKPSARKVRNAKLAKPKRPRSRARSSAARARSSASRTSRA